MDHLTRKRRSWNMSRIRSKGTAPEIAVRKSLTRLGWRYRLHSPKLAGKPDVIISKAGTIIFINGCFWHQHKGCKRQAMPKANKSYWLPKLKRNIQKQVFCWWGFKRRVTIRRQKKYIWIFGLWQEKIRVFFYFLIPKKLAEQGTFRSLLGWRKMRQTLLFKILLKKGLV